MDDIDFDEKPVDTDSPKEGTPTSIWYEIGRFIFYGILIIFVLGIIAVGACVMMFDI